MALGYVIGQYNKNILNDNNDFITPITGATAERKENTGDSELGGGGLNFYDECLKFESPLSSSRNYYFHGKIKRMTSLQTFYIKLVYFSPSGEDQNIEQYIKTIDIAAGNPDDWVDIEFMFSPLRAFDCLLFELKRSTEDFRKETRFGLIAYQEVGEIKNVITSKIADGVKLIKLGVQSRPGLMMCINGEEIRTCRTGIYELKNGIMTVSFFSVASAAKENGNEMINYINDTNEIIDDILARQETSEITDDEAQALKEQVHSRVFLATDKTRVIDSFTLDYMYREED